MNIEQKFILGLLTDSLAGNSLIKEAVEQGDKFAQLHSTIAYGCYSDENLAMELLQGQLS